MPSPFLFLCAAAVLSYIVCFGLLLRHRVDHSVGWQSGRSPPQAPTRALRLCRPFTGRQMLLVEIPFTTADVRSLEISAATWETTWPCTGFAPFRPDLLLAFNGNISEPRHKSIRERVEKVLTRPVVRQCFGHATVESACLSVENDVYDKRRLNANWTIGPNNLFFHFLRAAASRGYKYMVQLEPDILPLRPHWLDKLHCLAAHGDSWVIGSPFLSRCARNTQTQRCEGLGDEMKFHLNGNALYATNDSRFRHYWERAQSNDLRLWPFDLALHLHSREYTEVSRRWLSTKFSASPVLLNYGAEPLRVSVAHLRRSNPGAYLLHSSWAMKALRQGEAVAGVTGPGLPTAPAANATEPWLATGAMALQQPALQQPLDQARLAAPAALASPAKPVAPTSSKLAPSVATPIVPASTGSEDGMPELVRLSHRQADVGGRLILSFVTSAYDELCMNFVAHLRRVGVSAYLLITFTPGYELTLRSRGEVAHLHPLPELRGGGSDQFASHDFFLVNSARYSVLTTLLRAGINVFSVDADVVVLRDPLAYVASQPHEVLLQSDARDGVSMQENSPFLLRDRLLRPPASSVTYVNGGVFFARGTAAVARLFEDTWALVSQDLGTLNEQDCLNRMLLASSLRWAPLPPALFPNGYLYFRRPFPSPLRAAGGPVLVHCNWINGIAAKRFLFREVHLWAADFQPSQSVNSLSGAPPLQSAPVAGRRQAFGVTLESTAATDRKAAVEHGSPLRHAPQSPGYLDGQQFLAYRPAFSTESFGIGIQVAALRLAVGLANLTNRTLILPRFLMAPPAHDAMASGNESLSRVFTFFFEYVPFHNAFPDHRENAYLAAHWPKGLPKALSLPQPLSAEKVGGAAGAGGAGSDIGAKGADQMAPDATLESRLRSTASLPLLLLENLERTAASYGELMQQGPAALALQSPAARQLAAGLWSRALTAALRPAPELRVISEHIVAKLSVRLASLAKTKAKHSGTRQQGLAVPQCLHVRRRDLASAERLRGAAGAAQAGPPTLLVVEEADRDEGNEEANALAMQLGGDAIVGVGGDGPWPAAAQDVGGGDVRRPSVADETASYPAVAEVFAQPLWMSSFYPYWDAVEVLDYGDGRTLAYDFIQQLVCSSASRVYGDASDAFVSGVCEWKRAAIFQQQPRVGVADACSQHGLEETVEDSAAAVQRRQARKQRDPFSDRTADELASVHEDGDESFSASIPGPSQMPHFHFPVQVPPSGAVQLAAAARVDRP